MIRVLSSGSTKDTSSFLNRILNGDIYQDLDRYGKMGVNALASATPKDTGRTANSWTYRISRSRGRTTIAWENTHTNKGTNIAIILQYGHGTGTGGYVAGYDYINPAIRPIFDQISTSVWEKVTRA